MEFGERLASPSSSSSSLHMASSSASSSPAPPQTPSTKCSSPAPSPAGHVLHAAGEERLSMSSSSNGFPLVGPAPFGLYASGSGPPEFGGLGGLGLSALAAHAHFGAFPDWWRPSEAHARGAAAFFPPLMGLHPAFASAFKSQDPAHLQSRTSGVTGAVNGRSASSPTGNSAVNTSSFPTKGGTDKSKANSSLSQKKSQDLGQLRQKTSPKTKEKKSNKKPPESSSMSGSQSGSMSESSSNGEESSSDPDDVEEEDEEEDEDEDEDDQSNYSDDCDSEQDSAKKRKVKRLTHDASESKKKRPPPAAGSAAPDSRRDVGPAASSRRLLLPAAPRPPAAAAVAFPQGCRPGDDDGQQHISVIQATGLAAGGSPRAPSHREASPLAQPVPFPNSPRHLPHPPSPKQSPSPKPLALCSPSKAPPLCSPAKPAFPSPPSRPAAPPASRQPRNKPKFILPSPKHALHADGMKDGLPDSGSLHAIAFNLKQSLHSLDPVKQAFPHGPKAQSCSDANLFLGRHLNGGVAGAVQDAPLALITKPRSQGVRAPQSSPSPPYPMPINLSTGSKETSGGCSSPAKPSGVPHPPRKSRNPRPACVGSSLSTAVALVRSSESDMHSSKDSDDSLGDDYDDEDDAEDDDSGSSLSESESNLESDSDGSEDDVKESEARSEAEGTPKPPRASSSALGKSPSTANCSLLNLQILKPPSLAGALLPAAAAAAGSGALSGHGALSPAFTFSTLPGTGKRRRVTDERVLRLPLEFGWQRETRIRTVAGRLQGEVAYFAPCGKKLRQYPDVMKYLLRNGITEISRDNFSFSTKIKVGDFYEARECPEGSQWCLLAEDEIAPRIIAMDGRRSRCPRAEQQAVGNGAAAAASQWKSHPLNVGENNSHDVSDAKLLRKLEAQEIARQAAQIKMMRKLEKQAMAQAAKEARKQQAMMAAEERRKKREQMKILKQQEKIKRIQQIRMEKELRAQQILEAKRRKKEEAANAKILEAEKRNKEKEMRRLQAVILKHQELERHRLDMERERRRQHMMLMKAVEARKKAEEKERLKREKKDEKRLNKERKLELRRLELEKARELKKPNEDMCLADHKPLPELSRVPGLVLCGSTFSDCLMVLQFLHSFGRVLRLDFDPQTLGLGELQEGLLNVGDGMGKVQDLLVSMLSAAVCDPGIPAGHKNKTALGDHLTNVGINRDNASEVLRIYMRGHCERTQLAALALSLRTKAFQAHSPAQKASMLAFLVNELCCSKAVVSEIEKNIDHMTNLRKDKWSVEGRLRKLRSLHAKKTGKREPFVVPAARSKCKRKEGDSEEEEDEDEDSDEQGEDEEEEEEESGGKKGKKAEMCEEEEDSAQPANMEELEKQIERMYKQQSQIRQKLFDSSQSLRSMPIGQDRYRRRYWVLPQCGGIFVEGIGSGEGHEETEKERKRQWAPQATRVKEEEEAEETSAVCGPAENTDCRFITPESQQDKDSLNLFLQKPGSFSKLSKLLEVAKTAQDSDISHSAKVPAAASYPSYPSPQISSPLQGPTDKPDSSAPPPPLKSGAWPTCGPPSLRHDEPRVSKALMERSSQWFSLFPRSPCDESSVTAGCSPAAAAPSSPSALQSISARSPPAAPSPNPPATAAAGINTSVLQHAASALHQSRPPPPPPPPAAATSPAQLLPPPLDPASQHAEGNRGGLLLPANNGPAVKSEAPEPPGDKAVGASLPAAEAARTQDHPGPQPVPEEMLHGWWRVSHMEELRRLVDALHSRGIREKVLQKQLQKHMEFMTELCTDSKEGMDEAELDQQEVSEETVETWCVEEQAMEVDIGLLQQVENLERKVISASLQVKGWMHPEPQSERYDLVYHEHKLLSSSCSSLETSRQSETSPEEQPGAVVRRPNNPLDIAVLRLADLERNIERSEEEVPPGMKLWRKALAEVRSSAQLSLCVQQLQKSIAWERAIMKVHCQLCQKGDNEELLLLCDGCDRGCHTYCHKPKITTVPDGDWFCPACAAKESGQSSRSRRQQSRTAGGGKRASEVKRNGKPSAVGELIKEEAASSNSVPKKGTKEARKRKGDDSPPGSQAGRDSPVFCLKRAKTAKDSNTNGLAMCRSLLAELEAHQDAWPFLTPVDHKAVPGYRKIIKKPMDLSTIREKLSNNQYSNLETFIIDVNLIFENCERFNEDDSEIGRAGHRMRSFFDKRWTELLK